MNTYGKTTVRSILNHVLSHKDLYPNGLDTVVLTGDFEGNYTHGKHEIQHMPKDDVVNENCVCICYEMHENLY